MLEIEPTKEQLNQAKKYIKSWEEKWGYVKDYFKADYFKRLFGLTGQIVISDYLGIKTPENIGPDGGSDITWHSKTWDVKTEIRNVFFKRNFRHNLFAGQINNQVEGYIFLNYNQVQGVFELCGWIEKINFLENAEYFHGGTKRKRDDGTEMTIQEGGMYELKQEYLAKFKGKKEGKNV